jgi:SAM-dependent methyltransferase
MSLLFALRNIAAQAHKQGFWAAVHTVRQRAFVRWRERQLGISTEAILSLEELGITDKSYRHYVPANYNYINIALQSINVDQDDVFLDIGSGMGRVVIAAAAMHNFRRVMGVEISELLNSIARENVERSKQNLSCKNIEFHTKDASLFEIPTDVSVIFFFNPFSGDALNKTMENIRSSLRLVPRELLIVCLIPMPSSFATEIGRQAFWLSIEKDLPLNDNMRCVIFSAKAAAA